MRLYAILLIVFSALVFWGCSSPEAPSIVGVSDVRLNDLADIGFTLTLQNPNPKKLTIKKVKAELWLDGSPIAQIKLREPLVLPKQSETTITNSLALTFRSEGDELRFMLAAATWRNGHKWEVSFSARGYYGLMPFRKTVSRTSYEQIQREFRLPAFP